MGVKVIKVDSKYPDALRVKGAIIKDIAPVVILITLFAVLIVCLHLYAGRDMSLDIIVLTVLSTVVSLLISLRTNSAYDRFWEARKLWSQLTFNIRNMSRGVWVLVSTRRTLEDNCYCAELQLKRAVIGMMVALCYATKDQLSGVPKSMDKIYQLMDHVPGFRDQINRTGNKREVAEAHYQQQFQRQSMISRRSRQSAKSPFDHASVHTPGFFKRLGAWFVMAFRAQWLHQGVTSTQTIRRRDRFPKPNIPNIIATHLSVYVLHLFQKEYIQGAMASNMQTNLNAIMEGFTQLERIQCTPIPLAYAVHLHQTTWILLLTLPFQLVPTFGWVTVPVVAMAAFTLFGILKIGEQIENPFNGDENDLPLDLFCEIIASELDGISSVPFAFKSNQWVPVKKLIEDHPKESDEDDDNQLLRSQQLNEKAAAPADELRVEIGERTSSLGQSSADAASLTKRTPTSAKSKKAGGGGSGLGFGGD
ncbi:hypothetical protein IWQ61_001822 [Dispira simplex]|nr:hypothetical protein IWQ61_001822 [Dispira simplex]